MMRKGEFLFTFLYGFGFGGIIMGYVANYNRPQLSTATMCLIISGLLRITTKK